MCEGDYDEEGLPSRHGGNIALLEKGDEVLIKAGFGHPVYQEDRTDVIAGVDQFSALTTSGVMLSCHDDQGVAKTGKTMPVALSQEAVAVLREVGRTPEDI
ncbi:MAG: hypothetical protein MUP45_02260 [Candidatus Marinimicrobia bacterium]|nr:hypothetical protein [Candidatus Neomarinimicrobiota bacterium]